MNDGDTQQTPPATHKQNKTNQQEQVGPYRYSHHLAKLDVAWLDGGRRVQFRALQWYREVTAAAAAGDDAGADPSAHPATDPPPNE